MAKAKVKGKDRGPTQVLTYVGPPSSSLNSWRSTDGALSAGASIISWRGGDSIIKSASGIYFHAGDPRVVRCANVSQGVQGSPTSV